MAERSPDSSYCSICLNVFTKPKILECFHTFCETCLENYVHKASKNNKFPCALCRKIITIPPNGVKGFTCNFYIKDSQEDFTIPDGTCPEHDDKPYDSYCVDCSIIACRQCLMCNHLDHNITNLEDASQDIRQELDKNKQQLQMQLIQFRAYTDSVRSRIVDIKEGSLQVTDEIESHVGDLCEAVRKCGRQLAKCVQKTAVKEEKKLNKFIVDTKNIIHQAEANTYYASYIVKKNNMEDILNVKTLLEKQYELNKDHHLANVPKVLMTLFTSAEFPDQDFLMDNIGGLHTIQEHLVEYCFNVDRITGKHTEIESPIFKRGGYTWQLKAGIEETSKKQKSKLYITLTFIDKNDSGVYGETCFDDDDDEEDGDENKDDDGIDFSEVGDDDLKVFEDADEVATKINLKLVNNRNPSKSLSMSQHHTFSMDNKTVDWSGIIQVKHLPREAFLSQDGCISVRARLGYLVTKIPVKH